MDESETDLIPPSKTPGQFHMPQGRQIPLKIIFIYAKFVADFLIASASVNLGNCLIASLLNSPLITFLDK